jgi:hypothetical protein
VAVNGAGMEVADAALSDAASGRVKTETGAEAGGVSDLIEVRRAEVVELLKLLGVLELAGLDDEAGPPPVMRVCLRCARVKPAAEFGNAAGRSVCAGCSG